MQKDRARLRELGVIIGELPPGKHNAITDVAGVKVGHATVSFGAGQLKPGQGPARTGVTAVLPHSGSIFREKVEAAAYVINGFGKSLGLAQVQELGQLESPILLTNTLNVGLVADAAVGYMIEQSPEIGVTTGTVNVVVGECNDGYLNDIQGRHVKESHVLQALREATTGRVEEGAVGGGAGMVAFGFKGGIGTASRVLPTDAGGFTVGALVMSNFGSRRQLTIAGVPVGKHLADYREERQEDGSIMVLIATDAPLQSRQLLRLCKRVPFGLARTGSIASHGSGDFALAFSTTMRQQHGVSFSQSGRASLPEDGKLLTQLFQATVESTEEAVLNSLCMAETVQGRDGRIVPALPLDKMMELLNSYGRFGEGS